MNILFDLFDAGFVIVSESEKFILTNLRMNHSSTHNSFKDAAQEAYKLLNSDRKIEWVAIARYNRGFGIEYKNLTDVFAASREEALVLAKIKAEKEFADPKTVISELKVYPKK